MNSFELNNKKLESNNNLEKNKDFSPKQEFFLEKELKKMENDALLEEDFRGKIDDNIIDKCLLEIEEYEKNIIQNNKIDEIKDQIEDRNDRSKEYNKVSNYLEALFYNKLGGEKGWIPGATVWKTSRYDDLKGIDFIVENEQREFSLEIDVTFSHNKGLLQKLNKLKNKIEIGKFTEPIFYESESKTKEIIPQIVIAVEREKIIKALKLWADGQGDLLEKHPIMIKTLLEIEAQLEAFAFFAKSKNKRNIAVSCNDMLSQIQRLIISHNDIKEKYIDIIEEDEAYKKIISFCYNLKMEASKIN